MKYSAIPVLLLALLPPNCAAHAQGSGFANRETVYDFLVQDVCVDGAGKIMQNATPVDDSSRCPRHRNLQIGERLPYHKSDWPHADQAAMHVNGYQIDDTFPIDTKKYGAVVVQSRVFLAADGSYTGRRGGGVYIISPNSAASGITEDPNGIQLFFGPGCQSPDVSQRILDAWVVVDKTYSPSHPGNVVARLTRFPERCPQLTFAYTSWETVPVTFRVRSGGVVKSAGFETLISDHFGGKAPELAPNMERFYFTRELGLLRWERWQNFDRQKRSTDAERADEMSRSNQCDPVQHRPAGGGNWAMVACRQYTNLVPAAASEGDSSTEWIDRIRSDPATQGLFAR